MLKNLDPTTVGVTVGISLAVALLVLAVRLWALNRLRGDRQAEARQKQERLRALLGACRALAGSFTPAAAADGRQMEEALAEVLLFGDLPQVALAAEAARALAAGQMPDVQPLVALLRADVRGLLGLAPWPADLVLPPAGPGKAGRQGNGRSRGLDEG